MNSLSLDKVTSEPPLTHLQNKGDNIHPLTQHHTTDLCMTEYKTGNDLITDCGTCRYPGHINYLAAGYLLLHLAIRSQRADFLNSPTQPSITS